MSRSRLSVGVVVSVVIGTVLALLAACSSDGPADPPESGGTRAAERPQPVQLTPDWSVATPAGGLGGLSPVADGSVLLDGRRVVRLAPDGTQRWERRIGKTCATSEPNERGDVAFSAGPKCRSVSVVDGRTGEVRWTVRIPLVSARYDSGRMQVTIGERAVTLVQFCGQVTRLAVADGRRLGILSPHDRKCANEADSDGRLIAVWQDPEDADTPDDHGTGWVRQTPGTGSFALYDADSGRQLWRRKADRQTSSLRAGAVVSAKPLVLALEDRGHTTLRRYTRHDATPGPAIGRQVPGSTGSFTSLGIADGVLVGTFADNALTGLTLVHAFDLTTGAELWRRDLLPSRGAQISVAGVDEDGVLVSSTTRGDETRTWLLRWDLRTGEDAGVLGVLPDAQSAVALDEDAVFLRSERALSQVSLVPADPEVSLPRDEGADEGWADDDVREVADCAAVSDDSLRLLGLRVSADLPIPADCVWRETAEPRDAPRVLSVNVTVAAPTGLGDHRTSAVDVAKETLAQLLEGQSARTTGDDTELALSAPQPLAGLGDEAYAVAGARLNGSHGAATGGYLGVRVRNVVVEVRYAGTFDVANRHAAPAPLEHVEDGLLQVARETLASYGITLEAGPDRAADGSRQQVPDVCAVLARDVRRTGLTGPTVLTAPGSGPRTSSCAWSGTGDPADELVVHAYAVDGGLFSADTGEARAQAIFAGSTGGTRPLRGLGDQAAIERRDATQAADDYEISSRQLWVREGNLLVNVDYERWSAGQGASVEAEARRLARKVLRASRG